MAGGYFAISAKWFWELGGYDEGLEVWGGEQYEISFKIWQCGGKMLDAPCSHVGHIYRMFNPFGSVPGITNYVIRNNKRVAEVWMDEFKEDLYARNSAYSLTDAGNVSRMLNVRKGLNCKPFSWFLQNVVPDMLDIFPYKKRPHIASGLLRNLGRTPAVCLDTSGAAKTMRPTMASCGIESVYLPGRQVLYTEKGLLRPWATGKEDTCFFPMGITPDAMIGMHRCNETNPTNMEVWTYSLDTKQFKNVGSGLCLSTRGVDVIVSNCDADQSAQKWEFSQLNQTKLETIVINKKPT